jgi:hypothetical protein
MGIKKMNLKPFKKDGGGYGNLDMANQHESDKETPIRLGSQGEEEKGETYIGLPARNGKKMTLNKIQHTKVGDDIHFFVNGVENRGIVVKMGGTYVSVFKEDGNIHDIPINDTFFVKDILINKTWDQMSDEERVDILQQVRAYSPRFVQKNWDDLPRELKTVISEKSDGFKKLKPVYEGDTEQADKATGIEQNHDKDNLEVEEANHAQTGFAQTQQNTIGKQSAEDIDDQNTFSSSAQEPMQSHALQSRSARNEAEEGLTYEEAMDKVGDPTKLKQALPSVGLSSDTAVEAEHRQDKNPTRGKHPKKSIDDTLKTILELKSDVEEGKYGNVGSTAEVLVSTDTPLDVSESTGYEDRPHLSLEDVGKLPRSNSKPHHSNEVKESKDIEVLEPKYIKQDKKKIRELEHAKEDINEHIKEMKKKTQTGVENTSEGGAFNPVYNAYDTPITPEETITGRKIAGRDQIKKGVPLSNVNTWGLQYVTKEDDVVDSLKTGIKGKYMFEGKHIGDVNEFDLKNWHGHITLHNMPHLAEYGALDQGAEVHTEDGKVHRAPSPEQGSLLGDTQGGGGNKGGRQGGEHKELDVPEIKTWDEGVDSDVSEESKA